MVLSVLRVNFLFRFSHDFLDVSIASEVSVTPDVIQGETGRHTDLKAGFYQAKGDVITRTLARPRLLRVRPERPFAVSTKMWSEHPNLTIVQFSYCC